MKTELIMTIDFIFEAEETGKRIVGGAEAHYPANDLSWLDFTGREIMIRTAEKDLFFKVKKIDVFSSISGALNLGFTLEEDISVEAVSVGDKVFKI